MSIWYDHSSYSGQKSTWQALDLQKVDSGPYLLHDDSDSQVHRYTFTGNLASPFTSTDKVYKGRRVPFTVRYRIDPSAEWQWVYHNFGTLDGELILQPPIDPNFLGASPIDLKPGWIARKLASEAPEARLYNIESVEAVPPTIEGDATVQRAVVGHVLQTCRWFGLVRIWSPWLAPRHGHNQLQLSEPAILLSFLRTDGLHVVALAANGIDDVLSTFTSSDDGEIVMELRNDTEKPRKFHFLAASAWDFELALCAVMYEMRKLVRESTGYQDLVKQLPEEIKAESVESEEGAVLVSKTAGAQDDPAPTPHWLQSWYDSLAYCTWNSLGQDLNLDKILNALDSFKAIHVHFSTLIIDDNWQSLTGKQGDNQFGRGWTQFEANSEGFPGGLQAATAAIRKRHPSINDIAVWHALMGYWGGIAPSGQIAQSYTTKTVSLSSRMPTPSTKTVIDPSDIHRLYRDFYTFLSESGVTAVKTDVQMMLDELTSTPDRRNFTTSYISAWTQAHLTHLSGRAISCMSCIPQILFHAFLPTITPRIMLRNSDDFFPDIPESHPWHVFCNAHNALFVQHLNVLPDWDMFQTSHAYSGFHAAARCLSGGPIYITDTPGAHDADLIHRMSAMNARGETVILRPSNVGKTVGVYDKYDDRSVLKIGVWDGKSGVGTGLLGVFNLAEKEVGFVLPVTKIPGLSVPVGEERGVGRWVVRSHVSRRVTRPITPVIPFTAGTLLQGRLKVRGYDIWSAVPVREVQLESGMVEVAVLGLVGKMTGACAIIESHVEPSENDKRLKVRVQLKALGTLGIWVNDPEGTEERWKTDGMMVMIQGRAIPMDKVAVTAEGIDASDLGTRILEVDVWGAWKEMELEAGWNNEVGVELFIS